MNPPDPYATEILWLTRWGVWIAAVGLLSPLALWIYRSRTRTQPLLRFIQALPDKGADHFDLQEARQASTGHDEAALALVGALLEASTTASVTVFGRGPDLDHPKGLTYLKALESFLRRGLPYQRILVLDPRHPKQGVQWLMAMERFASAGILNECHEVRILEDALFEGDIKFQIIESGPTLFAHATIRDDARATRPGGTRGRDCFYEGEHHPEIRNLQKRFEAAWDRAERVEGASGFALHLNRWISRLKPSEAQLCFQPDWVLDVDRKLSKAGLQRHFDWVGCLPPTNFDHKAAQIFCRQNATPLVALSFDRLSGAAESFLSGKIEYFCEPVGSDGVTEGAFTPLDLTQDQRASLATHRVERSEELEITFVLAAVLPLEAAPAALAATAPAKAQVERMAGLEDRQWVSADSNLHAALLAAENPSMAAITTREAAMHLGLNCARPLDPHAKTTFYLRSQGRLSPSKVPS